MPPTKPRDFSKWIERFQNFRQRDFEDFAQQLSEQNPRSYRDLVDALREVRVGFPPPPSEPGSRPSPH